MSEVETFARFRSRMDFGSLLRGASAFAGEWQRNKREYIRSDHHSYLIEAKMDGIIVASAVDSFLAYISDLLILIFSKRPEMIGEKKISQKILWEMENINDIRWRSIENHVHELSYLGWIELDKYMKLQYKFPISFGSLNRSRISYIIEIRNCVVHNRGIFSRISDERLGGKGRLVDRVAYKGQVSPVIAYLIRQMDMIDTSAIKKFSLQHCTASDRAKWLNDFGAKQDA